MIQRSKKRTYRQWLVTVTPLKTKEEARDRANSAIAKRRERRLCPQHIPVRLHDTAILASLRVSAAEEEDEEEE